jgi:hypothetical protein
VPADPEPFVVEANEMRPVRFLSAVELPPTATFDVVSHDCFDDHRDLPSPGDRVTIAAGEKVVRGEVAAIVFLLEVERRDV